MSHLFHVTEERLRPGATIQPGRWGRLVLTGGANERFFFREHLLEIWRRDKTKVAVSRLACTFAFEAEDQAHDWASEKEHVLAVTPVDPSAPRARLDMLWLAWMSEPLTTTDKMIAYCAGYWGGRATTDVKPSVKACWEWLSACPLMVMK